MKFKSPEFVIYTGPMFSSKTTSLLIAADKAKRQGFEVIAFKSALDGRYNECAISTHSGWRLPAHAVDNGRDILDFVDKLKKENQEKKFFFIIDEVFMIENSAEAILDLYKSGYNVHVASIQLSSKGQSFIEMEKLMPWATKIIVCKAVCSVCGESAYYTFRHGDNDEDILVGTDNFYEPRCWQHFPRIRRT